MVSKHFALAAAMSALLCMTVPALAQAPAGTPGAAPGGPPGAGPDGGGLLDGTKPLTAPPKAAPEKIRMFTGNWVSRQGGGVLSPGVAPFRPEYEARVEQVAKLAAAGEDVPGNEPRCIPNGPIMDLKFGMRVLADAQQLVVITNGPRVRAIWLDGRKHSTDDYLFESYGGESIGRWEGDTLVVDTIGLLSTNEVTFGVPANDPNVHLVERWRLVSPTTLAVEFTIEDPALFTRPWTYTHTYVRQPLSADTTYCVSGVDRMREGKLDLTPPPGGYIPPGAKK